MSNECIFPATHRQFIADSNAGVALFASMGARCAKESLKLWWPRAMVLCQV